MAFRQKEDKKERRTLDLGKFPNWKITHVRVVSEKLATFTLELCDGLALYGMKCFYVEGKGYYIASAQTPYTDKNGEKRYANNYGLYLSSDAEKELIEDVRGEVES